MGATRFISDAQDILGDADSYDQNAKGKITDVKVHTIRRLFRKHDLSSGEIAERLSLDERDVKAVLSVGVDQIVY